MSAIARMDGFPSVGFSRVPAVTAAEMRDIDRLATEEFGIGLVQMMELAGANLARVAQEFVGGTSGRAITVLVGPGNNGSGGLVAARHLVNRGADVHVVLSQPVNRLPSLPRERLATLLEMRVRACVAGWDLLDGELDDLLAGSALILDALLGYAAEGPPRGELAALVASALDSRRPVLSLDLPTGLHADDGTTSGAHLIAAATVTLALPKRGLLTPTGRQLSGETYLADIGLPQALYRRAGLDFADPFSLGPLVHLD